jgi:hypothetical protein
MNNPYTTLTPGDKGTVTGIDDTGTIFVNWDSGSGLGLVYGVDSYKRVSELIPEKTEMNEAEANFRGWLAVTESSRFKWVEDEIYRLNGRGALYYTGGTDGIYLRIKNDGMLEAGNYEGAIPHIGEALFTVVVEKQFPNFSDAFARAMEVGGKRFLIDMFSADDFQQPIIVTGRDEEKPSVLKTNP